MTVIGRVQNGAIVLDAPLALPDGTPVKVVPVEADTPPPAEPKLPSILEQLAPIVGIAEGLPPDGAANIDHYLYGHPKK